MSQFKTHKMILGLLGVFFAPLLALAEGQDQLAAGVKQLIFAEQHLLSRDLNENRISTPKDNKQDGQYKPENGQVFEVTSFWVDKSELKTFESAHISPNMKKIFRKTENGVEKFLFLVHPESVSMYQDFLKTAEVGPKFWATSTSSSRTLLMWPDAKPDLAFFGKLSLNKEIGGVVRTIPQGEAARSVGTNEVLYANKSNLPRSFEFMPESLAMIPKNFERGGMIIREIPADVASGKARFIPMFSLYADRGNLPPLLAEMIAKSGMDAPAFIQTKIIAPFVTQWTELAVKHGISTEPHAQNVLIGLDGNGMPNGKFLHRDFGGFNMDIPNFPQLNTSLPTNLPTATTVHSDYHQEFIDNSINQGIETYFEQGFVYNLDQKVPKWVEKGWIPAYRVPYSTDLSSRRGFFSKMIYTVMAKEMNRLSNQNATPAAADFKRDNIHKWVKFSRTFLPKIRSSCAQMF